MKESDQYIQIKKELEDFKVDLTVRIEIVERNQAVFPSNLIANKLTEQSLADLSKLYVAKLNNGSLKMTSMKKNESLLLNQKYYQIKQFEQDISGSGTDASNKIKQQLGQTSESLEGYAPDHPGFYVRYAVNGLSKTEPSGSGVPMNRNINRGDFGDDSGVICENSKCVIIGYLLIV